MLTDRRRLFSNDSLYDAEIEYLQGSETQWIDLGIIPDTNTKVQFKFKNLVATGGSILGYNNNTDTKDWRFFNYSQRAYFDVPGGSGNGNRINGGTININTIYELEIGNFYVKNLETNTILCSATAISSYTGNDTIKLNKKSSSLSVTNDISSNVWYYIKIYSNNDLIMDLIPVRKKQIGYLYDKISEQLFENLGTGEFILGPDKN